MESVGRWWRWRYLRELVVLAARHQYASLILKERRLRRVSKDGRESCFAAILRDGRVAASSG